MIAANPTKSHAELISNYLELFASMQFDQWAAQLWHLQGRYILAYPSAGFPSVIADGSEQLLTNMKGIASVVQRITTKNLEVVSSNTNDLFWASYQIEIQYAGGIYQNNILYKVKLRDGLIVELTEYYDRVKHEEFLRGVGFLN